MTGDVATLVGKVSELHGRAIEISSRIRQDAALLSSVHLELSGVLANLWSLYREPAPIPVTADAPQVLRIAAVSKRIGLGRSTIWQMAKDGEFPSPLNLSNRAVGWSATEVDEWLKSRKVNPPVRGSRRSVRR